MEIRQIKGNTWALIGWEWIPFYMLDDRHCIMLDSGLAANRQEIEEALISKGIKPVAVVGSHSHLDHYGSHAYFQRKYGAKIALPLGEAGLLSTNLGFYYQNIHQTTKDINDDQSRCDILCYADRIIMPNENSITMCGADFDIIRTPGHSLDHVCIRTPDNVLYVADAVMTGNTLENAVFPYAINMNAYFDSMEKLRGEKGDLFLAAHEGVYDDLDKIIDDAKETLTERLRSYLPLLEGGMMAGDFASAIARKFEVKGKSVGALSYFVTTTQGYLNFYREMGWAYCTIDDNKILYYRTGE